MPRVSVITPAYNSARYIQQTVESVLAQTFGDVEYIVVDDGSTDDTRAVLQPYVDAKRLTYIYQNNAERAVARNTGISHSSGEYLAFVDADDVWLPHKLQQQVQVLDAHPDVALVYGRAQFINAHGQPTKFLGRTEDGEAATGLVIQDQARALVVGDVVCGGGSCAMTRRSLIDQVGWFDEQLSYPEDWDQWLRLSRLGPLAYIPQVLMQYRVFGWSKVINMETSERIIQQHQHVIYKALLNWPPDLVEREQLRRQALASYHTRVALFAYQAGKTALGQTHLAHAIEQDPSLATRDNLVRLVTDRAKLIEGESGQLEPAQRFVQETFAHLPNNLQQHASAARSALSALCIGCAFDRFRAGQRTAARQLIWKGIRYAPAALKNRGVLSISMRSLLGKRSERASI